MIDAIITKGGCSYSMIFNDIILTVVLLSAAWDSSYSLLVPHQLLECKHCYRFQDVGISVGYITAQHQPQSISSKRLMFRIFNIVVSNAVAVRFIISPQN